MTTQLLYNLVFQIFLQLIPSLSRDYKDCSSISLHALHLIGLVAMMCSSKIVCLDVPLLIC